MNKVPKTLTLDVANWKCGKVDYTRNTEFTRGHGVTSLLNEEGFMCCLGQFALQLGLTPGNILNRGVPCTVSRNIVKLRPLLVDGYDDSCFSSDCMRINDNVKLTIHQKIVALTFLCEIEGITLKVINYEECAI